MFDSLNEVNLKFLLEKNHLKNTEKQTYQVYYSEASI